MAQWISEIPGTRPLHHPNGAWLLNYEPQHALHNLRFLSRCPQPVHIFVSRDCAAIVVSTLPLEAIHEPHVMAWRDSFYAITREELVMRAAEMANGKRDFIGQEPGRPVAAA